MKKILTIEYDTLKAILESQSWLRNPEILGGYEELDTYELMRKIEQESEVEEEVEMGDIVEHGDIEGDFDGIPVSYKIEYSGKKTEAEKKDIVIDPPEIQKSSKSYYSQNENILVTSDEDDMHVPANFILAYAKERHLKPNVFFLADQYNEVLQNLWKKFKRHWDGIHMVNGNANYTNEDFAWFMKHCISADNE